MADSVGNYQGNPYRNSYSGSAANSDKDYRRKFRKQGLAESTPAYNKAKKEYDERISSDEAETQKRALKSMGPKEPAEAQ